MKARGERAQDYGARRLWTAEAAKRTAEWEQQRQRGFLAPIPCPIACTCSRLPYPHLHEHQLHADSKAL